MKFVLIKIIFGFCIVLTISACHTFEHQNFFLQNNNRNLSPKLMDKEKKSSKVSDKKTIENNEMAPIKRPSQTEKVEKLALQKKIKIPNSKNFNIENFKNMSEKNLIKTLGKSNFIKEEGKLKNYQYYFKECFLDVFLLKKKDNYFVNYVETRPTKLYGQVDIRECFKEINRFIN